MIDSTSFHMRAASALAVSRDKICMMVLSIRSSTLMLKFIATS